MSKWLKSHSPASVKVEFLTASVCLESETNKTHSYKNGFLHVNKLTAYLVSLTKSLLLQ